MMKTAFIFITWIFMLSAAAVFADDRESGWKKAYPAAEKGVTRHVLHLPDQKDEDGMKVELIVGRTVETDGVNNYFFGGAIKEKTVTGWGYPRYDVQIGELASTMMGVPPDQPKVNKFVPITGGPHLLRYNSRLPIVVYAPEGVEVRYRFWKADIESKPVPRE
jgi:ecotin